MTEFNLLNFVMSQKTVGLALGGVFGSIVRLIISPRRPLAAWLAQLFVGVACAVFLGGAVAHWLGLEGEAIAGVGFAIGSSAEKLLEAVQNRFLHHVEKK